MIQELYIKLANEFGVTEEEFSSLAKVLKAKQYKKGDFLLKQGEIDSQIKFLLSGIVHQYLTSIGANSAQTKKRINKTTTSKIITELYALMDEEKLYKNPLLNRLDLATRLGTSEGYLSQVINQEINKSIIQFVNKYRIEAAKELLNNPVFNKYSVEAIGMEAGFKSKSAFYSTFNTNTGISPGAFRKLQKTS